MADDGRAAEAGDAGGLPGVPPAVVYVVQHARPRPDGEDDVKMIGVYASRDKADAAVARLVAQPGFRDWPDGFHADAYLLNRDHWTAGFVTVRAEDVPE